MKKWKLIGLLLAGALLWTNISGISTVQAAPESRYAVAGIEKPAEFEAAFLALQAALAANDRNKVADSILYPLRVNGWIDEVSGKGAKQFNRQEVMGNYDEIFSDQVKEAFARQKTADLFVNWQGVMVGKGEAWLSVSEKAPLRYGIIAVNLSL